MTDDISRLVSVGNVMVDVIAEVDALPASGGDVLANRSGLAPGGSFNTLVAAARQGLPAAYAGASGTGPFGDLVRTALRDAGIEVLVPATSGEDTGYDIAIVEPGGERRFITAFGAEATLTSGQLDLLELQPGDAVHVSGYGLLARTNAGVIPGWLLGIRSHHVVLFDPGPLVTDIDSGVLLAVLERTDWLSCNAHEAQQLSGLRRPPAAAQALAAAHDLGVVVRTGADGCVVSRNGETTSIPGFPLDPVDTNGAGDAHVGAFVAGLAAGLRPTAAARRANACAAIAVSRPGPATAPTLEEVEQLLAD